MAINYFFEGFRLIVQPGIRGYVYLPLLLNIIVFIALSILAIQQFGLAMNGLMNWLPEWLAFLSWLIWPLFGILLLSIYGYCFTLLGNLIAAPFFGVLSEKVQIHLAARTVCTGSFPLPPEQNWRQIAVRTLLREIRKLAYFLPRLLGVLLTCLMLSFIPVINLLAPILSFLWGAWNLYLQYIDYPADNNNIDFNNLLVKSRERRKDALGFGGIALVGSSIPLLNLLVMPAAVAGATALWLAQQEKSTDVGIENPTDRN